MTRCTSGHEVPDDQKFCGQCGVSVSHTTSTSPGNGSDAPTGEAGHAQPALPIHRYSEPRPVAAWRRNTPQVAFGAVAVALFLAGLLVGFLPAYTGDSDGDPTSCGSPFVVEDEFGQFGFCESEADLSTRRVHAWSLLVGGVVFAVAAMVWQPPLQGGSSQSKPDGSGTTGPLA